MDIQSINIFKKGVNKVLGDLESLILEALWSSEEPLSAREVTSAIEADHPISFNAVTTVIKRLEKKDLIKRKATGKRYRFYPSLSKEEYSRSIVVSGLTSLLSDKKLLSAAKLTGESTEKNIDKKTIELLKEFIDYEENNHRK